MMVMVMVILVCFFICVDKTRVVQPHRFIQRLSLSLGLKRQQNNATAQEEDGTHIKSSRSSGNHKRASLLTAAPRLSNRPVLLQQALGTDANVTVFQCMSAGANEAKRAGQRQARAKLACAPLESPRLQPTCTSYLHL